MATKKITREKFLAAVKGIDDERRPPCPVCNAPYQEELERMRLEGKPLIVLARALKKLGMYPDVGARAVSDKITTHFTEHLPN